MSKSKASAATEPVMINDSNLSLAWSRLLLHVLDRAGTEVSPLILSVTGFDENGMVPEDSVVRRTLDRLLKRKDRSTVEQVAFTIFPQRVWEMSRGDRGAVSPPVAARRGPAVLPPSARDREPRESGQR